MALKSVTYKGMLQHLDNISKHKYRRFKAIKNIINNKFHYYSVKQKLPGEPENGVNDVDGDNGPPWFDAPKILPGDVTKGGWGDVEGEDGLLAVPIAGGFILFSFCRLFQQ